MYGIDICNADLNYCLIRAKPLCLTPGQHAQVDRYFKRYKVSTSFITVHQFYCQTVCNDRIFQCEYIE